MSASKSKVRSNNNFYALVFCYNNKEFSIFCLVLRLVTGFLYLALLMVCINISKMVVHCIFTKHSLYLVDVDKYAVEPWATRRVRETNFIKDGHIHCCLSCIKDQKQVSDLFLPDLISSNTVIT